MTLQRLILTFKPEDVEIRTLYRSKDGPDPNTKGRTREVTEFTRVGLQQALEVLEDDAECVGTSGYEIRGDTISVDVAQKKGA